MRKVFGLILSLGMLQMAANAQKVTGTVKDQDNKVLDKTTVSLLRATDSSVVKLGVTDDQGKYSIDAQAGKYLLSFSRIGHTAAFSRIFEVAGADVTMEDILLGKAEQTMEAVVVTSQKPMIEVRADKTILNVEGTINATGNDALELLRKSPGVMVDKDDNLSLAGKNGVMVYIDGKPTPLAGADLANYLKSLQSAQIEAIELITNPSARYEAAGNAGIINIKLKKNKTFGTNGSVTAGYNIGTYGKYNGGFALNHRNSKMNIFGNYNYNHSLNLNSMKMYREQGDTIFNQQTSMKMRNNGHNFKTGVDFFLTPKSTIGAIINGNISANEIESEGPMSIVYKPTNTPDRVLLANTNIDMNRTNLNFNLNYRYAVTGGSELNIDADYGIFNLRNNQFQPNYYYDASNNTELYRNVYRMISPTNIDLYAIKADYEQNFKQGRLGYGGRVGYVRTDNDFNRYDVIGNTEIYDKDRSNRFEYRENVNAAYVNYNRAFTGIMLQAGVRVENTVSKGTSTGLKYNSGSGNYDPYDSSLNRNYTDVFPSASVTFNKNPMSMFSLTYSRRIDRPAYQDLNPFEFKLNDYTFMKGNTQLRPQYTNSYGITHIFKYKLTTTLNYSHVKDIFTQLPDTTEKSKSFLFKQNLATQDIISLNISYPFQYKSYGFFANINTNYSKYKADFGGGDRVVNLDAFTFQYFMQNTLKFGKTKTWTAELSGFYLSPSIWQGVFKSAAMYSVDGGVQKTIFKGNGTLKASVTDIFRTMRWKGSSNFSGQFGEASGRWESRQFRINFSYRFGNSQVKAARQRKTGLEDETKRTQDGGGQGGVPARQ